MMRIETIIVENTMYHSSKKLSIKYYNIQSTNSKKIVKRTLCKNKKKTS